MTELVQRGLERTVSELEEMQRIGLLNQFEIKQLVKARRIFEYKLRRMKKEKINIVTYINYERSLLLLIRKRRERLLIEAKRNEIEVPIAKRVNHLFKLATSYYTTDEKLWLDWINFCQEMKWNDSINSISTEMLKKNLNSPSLWLYAAKWEMEEARSPENARKVFQRAVLHIPKSPQIWKEFFRMELMNTDKVRKRKEILEAQKIEDTDKNDAVLSGQVAIVVFDKAVKEIENDVDFALSFIEVSLDFNFCQVHIEHIMEYVVQNFPDKEETLDAVAKKSLLSIDDQINQGKDLCIRKRTIIKDINNQICSSYETAIKEKPTEKMWSFYIQFVLSLLNSAKEKSKCRVQNQVIDVMKRAAFNDCLNAKYSSELVDHLLGSGDTETALSLSLSLSQKWNTVKLWTKCITCHIQNKAKKSISIKYIYYLFQEALNAVEPEKSNELWIMGAQWLILFWPENLLEFFEAGMHMPDKVSGPLKDMSLDYAASKDIETARNLYKKFKKMGALNNQIIQKIIRIESANMETSIKYFRKYYEDGLKEFGSTDIDIWLSYMKLEADHAHGDPSRCSVLYHRATKTLNEELIQEFHSKAMECSSTSGKQDLLTSMD